MLVQENTLELFADYYQFYLQDETVDGNLSESWTQEAVDRLLAITEGTIGVGTVRNMTVPVTIKIFSEEPALFDTFLYDQINECDLAINSGRIVVAGCTDYFPEAKRIETEVGLYRVRLYYQNLNLLRENDLEGDDTYELHLWKIHTPSNVVIRKHYNKASA